MQSFKLSPTIQLHEEIHQRAVTISERYLKAEAELIDILQQVEQHKVYSRKKYSSLFQYVVRELHLSESVAYNLITVSRKAKEVPELKTEIQKGNISLSNAKRIAPVLTPENQKEWLKKATELSQRQLEREVVRICPKAATPERVSYISYNGQGDARIKLEVGFSEKEILRLRRIQDLFSQTQRRPVSLEETITTLANAYLKQNDPIEKAKRHVARKGLQNNFNSSREELKAATPVANLINPRGFIRAPLPASILHQVNLRDERRCIFVIPNGSRCNQSRWIEIHHKIPVSQGGENTIENLATLCSTHHDLFHFQTING